MKRVQLFLVLIGASSASAMVTLQSPPPPPLYDNTTSPARLILPAAVPTYLDTSNVNPERERDSKDFEREMLKFMQDGGMPSAKTLRMLGYSPDLGYYFNVKKAIGFRYNDEEAMQILAAALSRRSTAYFAAAGTCGLIAFVSIVGAMPPKNPSRAEVSSVLAVKACVLSCLAAGGFGYLGLTDHVRSESIKRALARLKEKQTAV